MKLFGIDFTSAPNRRKPIVVAAGCFQGEGVQLTHFETLTDWAAFERFLQGAGPWLGAFDFPFGLPCEAIHDMGWPATWPTMVEHCNTLGRDAFRAALDRHRENRPAGQRYAHRATDHPARSHSPLKLVNPPVGLMFLEGAPRLLRAGVHIPLVSPGDTNRIAIEAYPGFLARQIERNSYKGDAASANTPERQAARQRIVDTLRTGQHSLSMPLRMSDEHCTEVLGDARGDRLDACLALLQAAWSARAGAPCYGLPDITDPLEGWIATVPVRPQRDEKPQPSTQGVVKDIERPGNGHETLLG